MPRLAGHRVEGLSVGGLETCIDLPELKLAFDIGRCPDSAVQRPTVLFTHAHMDHMGGVAWHAATRELRHLDPPTYVVPRENEGAFRELFAAWRGLDRSDLRHRVVPLGPGDELELPCRLIARPFRSPHRVPCQGYALWSRRRKLKREHLGKSEHELRDLGRSIGAAMYDVLEVPEIAFTGDTLIEVVEREEVVRRARLLILEVTFVDERVSVEQCRSKGHVHLFEVAERAALFENESLLFTHFSSRYSAAEIVAALERTLPEGLRRRVTPLLPAGPAVDADAR
jgi:ribonuclease Z